MIKQNAATFVYFYVLLKVTSPQKKGEENAFLKLTEVFFWGGTSITDRSYIYAYVCNATHLSADSVGKPDFTGFT